MVNFLRTDRNRQLITRFIIKPLAFLIYPAVHIIAVFFPFRIGVIQAGRIGHFAENTELYLCEKDCGIQPGNSFDIFGYRDVCNKHLLKMWKRVLYVRKYAYFLHLILRHLPNSNRYIIKTMDESDKTGPGGGDRDIYGLYSNTKPHLSFLPDEEKEAQKNLENMGIGENENYVCVAVRESQYLKEVYPYKDWRYHDYRNCNINNYSLSIKELIKRKNFVIRMGTHVENILELDNPRYIEYYSRGYHNDLMDIYLGANCKFFIGCGSGIDSTAVIFRRPLLFVNVVPIVSLGTTGTTSSTPLAIFKKYWLKNDKRFMTVREIFESGASKYYYSEEYSKHGIELIENSADEILDAVIEFDERLSGTWKTTEEYEELQNRFWSLYPLNYPQQIIKIRIGSKFLMKNRFLLE